MSKVVLLGGCSSRVLSDLLHKTAVSGVMSGSRAEDTHTCCCSYCCRGTENGDLAWTAKTELLPQERYQLAVKGDLLCLRWAIHMYTCLPWPIPAPSWPEGLGPQVLGGL